MALLLLAVLVLLVCRLWRGRSVGSPQTTTPATGSEQTIRTVRVGDVAFDYARAVLELDDLAEATKSRALWALERMILPLAGRFPLDAVTPELQAGVRALLVAELDGDGQAAVLVWEDLLRWGRLRLPPPQRRNR